MFIGKINVTLKESVLDPQGQAVMKALHDMGEGSVKDVRIGKYIEVKLLANSQSDAEEQINRFCKNLLVNQVIETYSYHVEKLEV
jgi:phosphoribosylformylglycinamidine synthase